MNGIIRAGIIIWLGIAGIILGITILVIKLIIDYAAKRIGKEVARNFNYDYLAKMIAYESKQKDNEE